MAKKLLNKRAFSETSVTKLLFMEIGGINGIFFLFMNLLSIDQYALQPI